MRLLCTLQTLNALHALPEQFYAHDAWPIVGQVMCSDACTDTLYDKYTNNLCHLVFEACPCEHLMLQLDAFCCLQAENPKQQYLLLHALNEVITSLNANTVLPDRQQDEVKLENSVQCMVTLQLDVLANNICHNTLHVSCQQVAFESSYSHCSRKFDSADLATVPNQVPCNLQILHAAI